MALQKKPPVVTIMGHVDHGKTTLLDFVRKTKLVAKEAGEITQSIGAYQIRVGNEKITFIDTPGHEAFSQMRSRGAQAADLVVLVVAANDGVMQQTKESIKIIKEAHVPFLVAINKIDLPEASIERTKTQLAEEGVFVEGYGGGIVAVPVSAKTGQGIDQLLEMILLTAELEDLKADPQGELKALVIESKADKLCGPIVSLVVQNGSLKKGAGVQADDLMARIKMIRDEWGKEVEGAFPADPVQILGFTRLPKVGSWVTTTGKSTERLPLVREETRQAQKVVGGENSLKVILKADVLGSLEAVVNCLPENIQVLEKSAGEITDSDILLAKTFGAEIYGFNLSLSSSVKKLAETEKVKVKTYKIIYDLVKDLNERASGHLEPEVKMKILGKAEILAVFEIKGERIAGGKVLEGKINKAFPVLLKRGQEELGKAKITSLKEKKQDINEAVAGTEFGAIFAEKLDFQPADVVISYSLE